MELVLKEWIGAGGEYVHLFNDSIIEINIQHHLSLIEKLQSSKKDNDIKKYLSDILDIKSRADIKLIDINQSKELLKNHYHNKLTKIISDEKKKHKIITEIDLINKNHKEKNKNHNVNPICEFVEIKGDIHVWTYQYAAEFEIPLDEKKTELLKIKIEPRNLISESNFKKMFEVIFNFHQLDNISGGQTNSFMLLYYLAFVGRIKEVLKRGIYREYLELEENLSFLKERLIISDHIKLNYFNKHKLYCGFSELTPNNFINQTIKATLKLIKIHFKEYTPLQQEVRKIQLGFFDEDVSDVPIKLNSIKNIKYNRQNKRFEEIMNYCQNILNNIGGSFSFDNKMNYSSFYIDMNELFETYVGKKLVETRIKTDEDNEGFYKIRDLIINSINTNVDSNETYIVELQNQRHYSLDEEDIFTIKPDFLIKNKDDKVIAVLDAKYKRLNDNQRNNYGISSSDVYQLLSYAHKFNANKMILIYPQPAEKFKENLSFTIKIDNVSDSEKILHICYINLINTINIVEK